MQTFIIKWCYVPQGCKNKGKVKGLWFYITVQDSALTFPQYGERNFNSHKHEIIFGGMALFWRQYGALCAENQTFPIFLFLP